MKKILALIWALALVAGANARATEITGAGSTFAYPILSKWSAAYQAATGDSLSYQAIGSSAGIAKIKAGDVDFGASDKPLKSDDLGALGLSQFPLVIGGVVPVVNIDGVKAGELKFTGPLLADIFLGKQRKWNDPAIKALNPNVQLPDEGINVVHRSDGSGTTFNWTNYLSKVSPEWRDKVGEGSTVDWPTGVGGKGSEGIAVYVNQIKNSIGYVEYAYAVHYNMSYALIQNKAGHFVSPNTKSFQAAAEGFDWNSTKDFYLIITDAAGNEAYPVAATTFVLMYKKPKDAQHSKSALEFFRWALNKGQTQAQELNYVPLPASLVRQIESYWKETIGAGM